MFLEINQKVLEPSGSKETGKICFKILSRAKKTPAAEKTSSQATPRLFCYFIVPLSQLRMVVKINPN
jgi:hypothetical protein